MSRVSKNGIKEFIFTQRTPLFFKVKLFSSYKRMLIFYLIFLVFYTFPLLIASNFDVFHPDYGIFRDFLMLGVPVIMFIGVLILKGILNELYQIFPFLNNNNVHFNVNKSNVLILDSYKFEEIFNEKGFKIFKSNIKNYMESQLEILFSLLMIFLASLIAYNNWWVVSEGTIQLTYYIAPSNIYTIITSVTLLIVGIILGFLTGSVIWYLFSFMYSVSRLDKMVIPQTKKQFIEQEIEDRNVQFQQFFSANFPESKTDDMLMSYFDFSWRFKYLGNFVFKTSLKLVLFAVLVLLIFVLSQSINFGRIEVGTFLVIISFVILIFIIFIILQLRMHTTLKNIKILSLNLLEREISVMVKEMLSANINIADSKYNDLRLANLLAIREKEQKTSTWVINFPFIVGILIPFTLSMVSAFFNNIMEFL